MKRKLARAVAWFLAFLAAVDLGLRLETLGLANGLLAAAHDPGKVFFGLLILPVAARSLVLGFPEGIIGAAWRRFRWFYAIPSASLVFGLSVTLAYFMTVSGFCSRPPVPEDLPTGNFQAELLRIQTDGHEKLKLALLKQVGAENLKKVSDEAEDRYDSEIGNARRNTECEFWKQSSARAKWSGFLNFPAILLAAIFVGLLFTHILLKTPLPQLSWDTLWVFVACFVIWQPLRAYSEWWIHFGARYTNDDMFSAAIVTALAIVLMFILRDTGATARRVASLLGAGVGLGTVAGLIKPDWFQAASAQFLQLRPIPLMLAYACGAGVVLSILWYVSTPQEIAEASQEISPGERADG